MSRPARDPYSVLGVSPEVTDGELRQAYRELVKRHHPDHNGGSRESAARFAQIQDAYARVLRARQGAGPQASAGRGGGDDAAIERRIADLERELAAAAARAAQRKPPPAPPRRESTPGDADEESPRPTPEQLGHYETDDSFTSILNDAAAALRRRIG